MLNEVKDVRSGCADDKRNPERDKNQVKHPLVIHVVERWSLRGVIGETYLTRLGITNRESNWTYISDIYLENENHSEGRAEREYSKEEMDSHEEADPQGYCDVDRDRMGSCYHFNQNLVENVFLEHVL